MAKVAPAAFPHSAEPPHRIQVPTAWAGERLDRAVARLFGDASRAEVQAWIEAGRVLVDAAPARAKTRLRGGEWLTVSPRRERDAEERGWEAAPVPVAVVHADAAIIVVAKPAGRVVHPAPGHRHDTLANGLLHRFPELAEVERAGIVHRLDRDTSGLLVVARTPAARDHLVAQFKAHSIERRYEAVVHGELTSGGRIDAPIARHPRHRTRFAVVADGKPAVTNYRVRRRFRGATLIEAELETGRTHQVRIHMAHIGYPVLGDPLYGGKGRVPPGLSAPARTVVQGFKHQALHAERLGLIHPETEEAMVWQWPRPEGLEDLIGALAETEQ